MTRKLMRGTKGYEEIKLQRQLKLHFTIETMSNYRGLFDSFDIFMIEYENSNIA